jgi:hypothetical protein
MLTVPGKLGAQVLASPVVWVPGQPSPVATMAADGWQPWLVDRSGSFISLASVVFPGSHPRYMQYTRPPAAPGVGPGFELAQPLDFDDPAKHRALVANPVPRVKEYADALIERLIREGRLPAAASPRGPQADPVHLRPPPETHESIARAFSDHLGTTAELQYSTRLRRENRAIDPVEEFLLHSRVGHCERFASALVLMLRSQGIPAVLVLGFKGCERVGPGRYVVRQEHAHAWVEAFISRPAAGAPPPGEAGPGNRPRRTWHWLTLDPEPAAEAGSAGAARRGWWAELGSALRAYFFDYTPENRANLLRSAGEAVREPAVLGSVGAVAALGLLVSRLRRRGPGQRGTPPSESGRWFGRLLAVLAAYGYSPRPGATPREFAEEVGESLRLHPRTAPHADVPAAWAEAHYRERFGREPIPDGSRAALEARLQELRRALQGLPSASNA